MRPRNCGPQVQQAPTQRTRNCEVAAVGDLKPQCLLRLRRTRDAAASSKHQQLRRSARSSLGGLDLSRHDTCFGPQECRKQYVGRCSLPRPSRTQLLVEASGLFRRPLPRRAWGGPLHERPSCFVSRCFAAKAKSPIYLPFFGAQHSCGPSFANRILLGVRGARGDLRAILVLLYFGST